ncbi:MAG: hypothetical protein IT243_05260 [Bacteroidia bacterium]|nr:hypothetical protein [Bacteroidia bacterium]
MIYQIFVKKIKPILFLICLFVLYLLFTTSCNDTSKPPIPADQNELITTLKIELKDTVSGALYSFFYRDIDGDSNTIPDQWDTVKLDTGRIYKVTLKFLNETNPNLITDVSTEIKAEATEHIICYTPSLAELNITRTDNDGTYSLGLESLWKTKGIANGNLNIKLMHQAGLKNGSCEPGVADSDITFRISIK